MRINIHPYERGFRIAVGLVFISLVFWGPMSLWYLLGVIPLATGIIGWCPIYSMLGMSTCKSTTTTPRLNS